MDAQVALTKILQSKNLQVYCEYYSISIEQIKQEPKIAVYLLEHQESLDKMINGYDEMGTLNQRICSEFQQCEQECQQKIIKQIG